MILGQFYLSLGIRRACPPGEYVEYKTVAVKDLHTQHFFDIPDLRCAEFVVKNDEINLFLFYKIGNFHQFAAAYKSPGIDGIQFLNEFTGHFSPCSIGQKCKFFKVFLLSFFG